MKTQETRVKEVAPDQNTVKKMQRSVEVAKEGIIQLYYIHNTPIIDHYCRSTFVMYSKCQTLYIKRQTKII